MEVVLFSFYVCSILAYSFITLKAICILYPVDENVVIYDWSSSRRWNERVTFRQLCGSDFCSAAPLPSSSK